MKTWFISDTHFGHTNIVKGVTRWEDKSKCRDFVNVSEMNETIINNWNSLVAKDDLVIHGGDFAFATKDVAYHIMSCLNGRIHLVLGNHDRKPAKMKEMGFIDATDYWFEDGILVYHNPEKVPRELYNKCTLFLYGHIHTNISPLEKSRNICVEHTEYKPILIER